MIDYQIKATVDSTLLGAESGYEIEGNDTIEDATLIKSNKTVHSILLLIV